MSRRGRLLLLLGLLAAPAPARAHDWYAGLRNAAGKLCCNDRDCHPVRQCVQSDGKEGLAIEDECRPIPWDEVLGVASPDGGAHACWSYINGVPNILCVILPGEM